MAFRYHGSSNSDLVSSLVQEGVISSKRVEDVMLAVDRADYCPRNPYVDAPQTIGYQATISAPHMHACALELLQV